MEKTPLEQMTTKPTADEVMDAWLYLGTLGVPDELANFTDGVGYKFPMLASSIEMQAGFENGVLIGLTIAHLRQQFPTPVNYFRSFRSADETGVGK